MLSRLYPILDSSFLPPRGAAREERLRGLMQELLSAGVTLLQYRNKQGGESAVLAEARILRAAVAPGQCLLMLNDYPALAVEAGFDGVHVGQEDMAVEKARALVGPERIVGVSTHNRKQLVAANFTSADYLAIGPVFATSSKENPDPVVGIEGVRAARLLTAKPLVAIGGITLENCKAALDAGADSVAVISSIFAASLPEDRRDGAAGKIARDFFGKLR